FVEFQDGSVLAQLGVPDMRLPIQYALTFPARRPGPAARLNPAGLGSLTFEEPDRASFPCLDLAYQAGRKGGTMPAVLNAANEEAVSLFLSRNLDFLGIAREVEGALSEHEVKPEPTLEDILEADGWARDFVRRRVKSR
ncbi:MAG: 1-deoxy-D-xylulose-5-phosphate reductoisomerase, partial [Firmicutes bacterium]|nr:1-deoxy-D-xylulose-5-phosphate reductoisomerase [Bacillota bacterium]